MTRFLVMADGPDEPGIVARVTGVLAKEGCNLEDTSMTRLGGRFVMLLMVQSDEHGDGEALLAALSEATSEFSLNIGIDWLDGSGAPAQVVAGKPWAVSVYGADHVGIVAGVTQTLADLRINIDDLTTRVVGSDDAPVYTMLIDVTVPNDVDGDELNRRLDALSVELGVTCRARPVDVDTL